MQSSSPNLTNNRVARAMLMSILYQDRLAHYLRLYVGVSVAIVVFMGMIGIISLESALRSIFYGGVFLSGGLILFIRKRRTWLLNIKDPHLKRQAHASMLAYLSLKGHLQEQAQAKKTDKERECTIF